MKTTESTVTKMESKQSETDRKGDSGMTLIDAIRTLRKEQGLSFEAARQKAIDFFAKKGLPLPEWAKKYRQGES